MANKRFIDFPIATTVGDNDIILIWQGGANKQTTKATILSGVPDSLNDLTDVTISGLTNGQILRYDSVTGQWENTDQGNLDLNDLNDVTIVSPTNGQVLVYNSSTGKWENSSGGYVPYVGAVTTVDLGLQGLEAGYVRFDTSIVSVPDEQGLMYWDASRSTVALIMNGTLQHIGQDTFFYVKNSSGSSIPKGTCVRFAGTDGASGHLLITPFLANGSVPSTYFLGVTAETITNGSFGQVMHFGELEGINTSSYTAGDLLYASTTVAGAFQTTAPVAPNNIVLVAAAVNSKNNGAIVVRPTYGSNINNDEGVKITSPTTGDLLQLQAGGLWENKTIDAAGIVTKATNQTITGVKTFSQDIIVNGVNVGRGGGNAVENTSTGNSALSANTTGSGNTANGSFALFKNTSGSGNTAVGTQSLTENTTGSGNTGIGWASLYKNTSGSNNSALGYLSLYENTTGQTNVGIGFYALFKNTTGNDNTALGYTSGAYIADGSTANSISNNSVYIGAYTKALANNQTNQIVIGHNAIGGGSNTVVIGNSSILSNRFFGTMRIGTINNGVGDFITTDANGVLTKRTGAEVRTDIGAGTVTSVAALTLGTSGTDLSSTVANGTTTPVITLNVPTASATNRGALSAADWTTFNNKQNALTLTTTGTSGAATLVGATLNIPQYQAALTNPVTGTGTTNYLPKFTGSTTIGNSIIQDAGTRIDVAGVLRLTQSSTTDIQAYTGSAYSNLFYDAASHNWQTSGGTAKMTLTSGGSLLVGTISDNGARLQVEHNGNSPLLISTSSTTLFTTYRSNSVVVGYIGNGDGIVTSGGATNFGIRAENDLIFTSGGNNRRLTISSTGAATFSSNVAAGSTSSGAQINVFASSYGNNGLFNAYGTDNFIKLQMGALGTNEGFIFTGSGNKISFFSGGNLALTLNSNQTATFSSSVTAGGIITANSDIHQVSTGGLYWGAPSTYVIGVTGNTANGNLSFITGSTVKLTIASTGSATFSSSVTANTLLTVYTPSSGSGVIFRHVSGTNNPGLFIETVESSRHVRLTASGSSVSGQLLQLGAEGNAGVLNIGASNVGIGTPSPSFQLHVNKAGNTGIFLSNTTGNAAGYLYAGGLDGLEIQSVDSSNSTAKKLMLEPYGGNVLIGTTTDSGARLNVQTSGSAVGGIRLTSATNTNGSAFVTSNAGGDSYFGRNNSTGGAFTGAAYATVVYGGGNYPMGFYTNDTERMRITSNGTIAFNGNSTPNSGGLDKLSLGFADGAYGWIQTWGGRALSLNSQGNNVLIGTTSDNGARLQVNGDITTSAPSGGTAGKWKLGTFTSGAVATGGRIRIEINGVAYDILTT